MQNINPNASMCNPMYGNATILGQMQSYNDNTSNYLNGFNNYEVNTMLEGLCKIISQDRWKFNEQYIINTNERQIFYKIYVCYAKNSNKIQQENIIIQDNDHQDIFDVALELRNTLVDYVVQNYENAENLLEKTTKCKKNADISKNAQKNKCDEFLIKVELDELGKKKIINMLKILFLIQENGKDNEITKKTYENLSKINIKDLMCPSNDVHNLSKLLLKFANIKKKLVKIQNEMDKNSKTIPYTGNYNVSKKGARKNKYNQKMQYDEMNKQILKIKKRYTYLQAYLDALDQCITINSGFFNTVIIEYNKKTKNKSQICKLIKIDESGNINPEFIKWYKKYKKQQKANLDKSKNYDAKKNDKTTKNKKVAEKNAKDNKTTKNKKVAEKSAKDNKTTKNDQIDEEGANNNRKRRDVTNKVDSSGAIQRLGAIGLAFSLLSQLFINSLY
ncbi:hypothetical protein BDAP_000711 [Binucleata daphniae]